MNDHQIIKNCQTKRSKSHTFPISVNLVTVFCTVRHDKRILLFSEVPKSVVFNRFAEESQTQTYDFVREPH